ncbi:MAG: bifunctional demethylmenaquinone methyltransferase/2-methoxy-6-polyprenyl-1,4-benzoquinol methylase UbiE [Aestuariivirgaceae bacterium]
MADFGFAQVEEEAKQGLVNEVFSKVAERYDQMNDLLSGGLHRLWKDDFVTWLNPPRGASSFHVLDVAGGTGDIAFRIARRGGAGTQTTIADISPQMVAEGKKRAMADHLTGKCRFTVGNAEALGFPDGSFDAYTIAFGIRNVTSIETALGEAYRVLKPGGRFMCLEFSSVAVPGLEQIYEAYSFSVIPAVGKVVTGDGQPYRYLVESIRQFPNQATFAGMIENAGFERVQFRNLSGGIVAMHSAWKI